MRLLVQKESEPITPYIFKVLHSGLLLWYLVSVVFTMFHYFRCNLSAKITTFLQSWLLEAAVGFKPFLILKVSMN
jgi:hypothetical protein